MVASLIKKSTISLSTWGNRGTAGLVEEWEPRVPLPEKTQQLRRRSKIPTPNSTGSTAGTGAQKGQ